MTFPQSTPPQSAPILVGNPFDTTQGSAGSHAETALTHHPARTNTAAAISLALACAAMFFCLGPLTGIPAIILGIVALWEIGSSEPKQRGVGMAWTGISVGTVSSLCFAALVWLVVAGSKEETSAYDPLFTPPPHLTTAPAPTTPSPTPSQTLAATIQWPTTETLVGRIHVVDIGAHAQSLDIELFDQVLAAERAKQRVLLNTTSSSDCRPCLGVAASLTDPLMQNALSDVRLVRVDVHDLGDELWDIGIDTRSYPGFFFLGPDLTPTDAIHGGEWEDDTADNIAPILGSFVRGTLAKRKYPFTARNTAPRNTTL